LSRKPKVVYNLRQEAVLNDILDRTADVILDVQREGFSHSEIIDALLVEAGWMIEMVASDDPLKADLRRIVGIFSETCAGLVGPARLDPRWN
jgi:hypothetical protein